MRFCTTGMDKWFQKISEGLFKREHFFFCIYAGEKLTEAPAVAPCDTLPTGEHCLELHMS
jgi:hypothetical protein